MNINLNVTELQYGYINQSLYDSKRNCVRLIATAKERLERELGKKEPEERAIRNHQASIRINTDEKERLQLLIRKIGDQNWSAYEKYDKENA